MTAQDVLTALRAAVDAVTIPPVLDLGERPRDGSDNPLPLPPEYVEIGLSSRSGAILRLAGKGDVTGFRVTLRAVSQSSASNVRRSLDACRSAIEYRALVVGSQTSTPIQFETEDPAALDDGWFSGLQTFTFTL